MDDDGCLLLKDNERQVLVGYTESSQISRSCGSKTCDLLSLTPAAPAGLLRLSPPGCAYLGLLLVDPRVPGGEAKVRFGGLARALRLT